MGKRVIWSPDALGELTEARKTVLNVSKSLKSANRLVREIFESTDILADQSEIYPLDKNKNDNDGTYRCYEVRRYNVSYRVLDDTIRIIRVRWSGQEPRKH
ncbi:type II toxin-antitoxin system RelE/ParE family toxin [Maribacter sp. MJ134]|uniref:type II toxin-antitoxin system RelE/ParE family toxin n=1 Tax=Maribacter sp. MJ134 TaxID=2496865 RepID=UPI000F8183A1|nr:type II toxin-antitoxin system RelE/ParE family toxin [Maribacter sp. MJ134]AZQ60446.1 type II toxin-antitoxin system RelE/ParE family toxin [Maribacter sp. MJ134]AZQ60461.1 type II toxin-antitoxin system RelE/ParE family toxin [Maribacter sp. MJ134]